jgi:hypothetical protein
MISRKRFKKGLAKAKKRTWWAKPSQNLQNPVNTSFVDKNFQPIDFNAEEFYQKQMRKHRKTTKGCSQYCCGNPRKWFKEKTNQEKRFEERAEE